MIQTRKLFRWPLLAARKLVGDATVASPTPASVPFSGIEDAKRRCCTCHGMTRLSSSLASGKRQHHLGVVSTARREPSFPYFKRYSASKMAALRATMPLFIHHLNKAHLLTPMQLAAFTPRHNGFHTFNELQQKKSNDSLDKIASKLVIGKDPSRPLLFIKADSIKESGSRRSMSSKSKSKCKSTSKSKSKGESCTYIMKPKAKKSSEKKITIEECCSYCDQRVREALDTLAAIVKCKAREIAEGSDDPFITGKKKKTKSKSVCKKKKKSKSKSKCKKSKSKSSMRKKSKSAPDICKKKSKKKIAGNLASKCKSDSAVSKKKSSRSLCKKKKKKKDVCKKKGKKKKKLTAVCKNKYAKHLCKKRPPKKSKKGLCKKSKKKVCKKSKKDISKSKSSKKKKKKSSSSVCSKKSSKKLKKKKSSRSLCQPSCKKSKKKKSSSSLCSKKSSKKLKKKKSSKSLCKKSSKKSRKKKKSSSSLCRKKSSKKLKKKSSKCIKKKKSSKDLCKKPSKKKSSSKSIRGKKKKSSKDMCKKKSSKDMCKKKSSKDVCKKKSSKDMCKKKSSKDICKKKSSKNLGKKKSSKSICKKKSSKDLCKKKSSKDICKKKSSKDLRKKKSSKSVCKKKSSKSVCKKKSSKDFCKKKSSKDICKKKSSKDMCKKKSSKDICKKKSSKKLCKKSSKKGKKKKSSKSLCKKRSKSKKKKKSKVKCNKSATSIGQNDYCVLKKSRSSKSLKKAHSAPCNAKLTVCPACNEIKAVCEAQHEKEIKGKVKDPLATCKKLLKKKSKKSKKGDEMTCVTPKQKKKKKSKPKCKKRKKKGKKGNTKCKRPKTKCSSLLGGHSIVCPGQDKVGVKFLSTESVRADVERSPSANSVKYDSKLGKFAAFDSVKKIQSKDKSPTSVPSLSLNKHERKSTSSVKYDSDTEKFVAFDSVRNTQSKDKSLTSVPSLSQNKHERKSISSVKYGSDTENLMAFDSVKKTQSEDKNLISVDSLSQDKHERKSTSSVKYDSDTGNFMTFDSVKKTQNEDKSLSSVSSLSQDKHERKPSSSVKYDSDTGNFMAFDSVKKTQNEDKSLSSVSSLSQDKHERKSISSVKYDSDTGNFMAFDSVKKTQSDDKSLASVPSVSQNKHERKSISNVSYDSDTENVMAFDSVKKTQSDDRSLASVPSLSQNKHERKSISSVKYDNNTGRFVASDFLKTTPTEGKRANAPSYGPSKSDKKSVSTPGENIRVELQDTEEKKNLVKTEDTNIDKIVSKLTQDNIESISDNDSYSDEVSVGQMLNQYSMNKGSKKGLADSTTSQTRIQPRKIEETGPLTFQNEVVIASSDKVHKTMLSVPPDAEKIVLEIDLKNIQHGPVITKITATPNHKVEVEQRRTQEMETTETEDIRKLNMPKDIAVKQPPKALSEVRLYTLQSPYRKQMIPQNLHKELKNYLKASGMDKPNTLVFEAKQVRPKKGNAKKLVEKNAVFDIKRDMHTGAPSIKEPLVNPLVKDMREPSFDTYSCREPMLMKLEIVDPCLGKTSIVDPQTEWYGPVVCYGRDLTNKTFADIYPSAQKKKKKQLEYDVFDCRRCEPAQEKPNFGACKYYHPMEEPTFGACTEPRTLDDIICPKKRDTFYGRLFKLPVAIDECEVVITYEPKPEASFWVVMKRKAMVKLAQRLRKEAEIRECCEAKRRAEEICHMKPPTPVDYCTLNFEQLVQCSNIKQRSRQMQEECFKQITARWNRMVLLRKRRQRKRMLHPPRYTDLPKRGTCATFMDSSQSVTMSPPGYELKPDYEYKGTAIAKSQSVRPEWRSNVASTLEVVAAQNNPNICVYRDGTARQLCLDYNKRKRKIKILGAGHPGPSRCNPQQICTCEENTNKDKDNKDDKEGKTKEKKKPSFIGSSILPVMMFNSEMFDELSKRGFFFLPEYNSRFTPALMTSIVCQFSEDSEGSIMSTTGAMLLPMYLMIECILSRVLPPLSRRDASTVQLVREGSLKKKIPSDNEHVNQPPDKKKSDATQKNSNRENVVRAIANYFSRLFPLNPQETNQKQSQEQRPVNEAATKPEQSASGVVVPKSVKDQTEQITENLRDVLKRRQEELKILLTQQQDAASKAFHEAEKKLKKSEELLDEVTKNINALQEKIKGITDVTNAKQRDLKEKLNSYYTQMTDTQQTLDQHITAQKRKLNSLKSTFSEVKGDAWKKLQSMSNTTEKIDKLRKAGLEETNKVLPKEVKQMGDMWSTTIKQMKETIQSIDKPENWDKLHQQVEEIRKMVHNKVTDPTFENTLKTLEGHITQATTKHRSTHLKTKVKELKDQLAKLKALTDKNADANAVQGKAPSLADLKAAAEKKKQEIEKLLKEVTQQDEENKGKGKK